MSHAMDALQGFMVLQGHFLDAQFEAEQKRARKIFLEKLLTPEELASLEEGAALKKKLADMEQKKEENRMMSLELKKEQQWDRILLESERARHHSQQEHVSSNNLCQSCYRDKLTIRSSCIHWYCVECEEKMTKFAEEWNLSRVRCFNCDREDNTGTIIDTLINNLQ